MSFLTDRIWNEITTRARSSTRPAHVAVAYLGAQGDQLLPLTPESLLVVDASLGMVRAGSTNPDALARLQSRGIHIFSAQRLHAKVFAFDRVGFVGSTNASSNSRSNLIEAAFKVRNPADLREMRAFVAGLCQNPLTASDLKALSKEYRPPRYVPTQPSGVPGSTLVMQLTGEQGTSRQTQVQPPKAVWEDFFQLDLDKSLPQLQIGPTGSPASDRRTVVWTKLSNTHRVEVPSAERGAIWLVHKVAPRTYDYEVVRSSDPRHIVLTRLLETTPNSRWSSGRRWLIL